MLEPRRGHERDVAEGRAAEVGEDGFVGLGVEAFGFVCEVGQHLVGHRPELLQVVLDVEVVVVDGRLADDGIEVPATGGHPPAGGHGFVAFGVQQQVAAGFRLGVEALRDEDGRAVEGGPRLPALVLEAEHRRRRAKRDDVHAQRVDQVRRDLAQHLVRLDDFDGRAGFVQPQRLPQPVDDADVHPGHGAGAQVEGDAIRFLVVEREIDAFS